MPADRLISLVIAAMVCVIAVLSGGGHALFDAVLWVVLALALIWFGDELGEYTGLMRGSLVTAQSPGSLVRFFGWLFLIGPLLYALYLLFSGASSSGAPSFE